MARRRRGIPCECGRGDYNPKWYDACVECREYGKVKQETVEEDVDAAYEGYNETLKQMDEEGRTAEGLPKEESAVESTDKPTVQTVETFLRIETFETKEGKFGWMMFTPKNDLFARGAGEFSTQESAIKQAERTRALYEVV